MACPEDLMVNGKNQLPQGSFQTFDSGLDPGLKDEVGEKRCRELFHRDRRRIVGLARELDRRPIQFENGQAA